MYKRQEYLAGAGRIGLGWGESGGEAAALMSTERYLAADGIENVIRVLSDLEDEKYPDLDFVELNACAGGCVGGVLQVENPYIAKAKMKHLRRTMPVSLNHITDELAELVRWDRDVRYNLSLIHICPAKRRCCMRWRPTCCPFGRVFRSACGSRASHNTKRRKDSLSGVFQ